MTKSIRVSTFLRSTILMNAILPSFLLSFLLLHNISCTQKNTEDTKDTFVFRIVSEPPSLDSSKATDGISMEILFNIMSGLMDFDKDLNVVPALAKSYHISPDGKTYTFELRDDAKWSDGVNVKAQDFFYAWQRLLDPKTASEYSYFLFDVAGAEDYSTGKIKDFSQVGVRAINDKTFEVKLKYPAAFWINVVAYPSTFPLRQDVIEKNGERWTEAKNMVVTGPYKMTAWEHDKRVVIEKNPNYFGSQPKISKAIAMIVQEGSTAVSLFESGRLDLVRTLPPNDNEKFEKMGKLMRAPYLRSYNYSFNVGKKPFDDVRVRKALAMAIDRQEFPKVLKGGQIPSSSWIPKGMLGYQADIGVQFDPKQAKALLAEAGFPEGKKFPKSIAVFDQRDDNRVIAELLQGMWKKNLGIDIELQSMEWKLFLDMQRSNTPQIYRSGWGADYPDPHNFMSLYTKASGNNNTHWSNPRFDVLIEQAAREMKMEKRISFYNEAQKILTEKDVAIIPLFTETTSYIISPRVKDFYIDALGSIAIKNYQLQ